MLLCMGDVDGYIERLNRLELLTEPEVRASVLGPSSAGQFADGGMRGCARGCVTRRLGAAMGRSDRTVLLPPSTSPCWMFVSGIDQIVWVCSRVKELLANESNIARLSSPVTVVGDIHGCPPA